MPRKKSDENIFEIKREDLRAILRKFDDVFDKIPTDPIKRKISPKSDFIDEPYIDIGLIQTELEAYYGDIIDFSKYLKGTQGREPYLPYELADIYALMARIIIDNTNLFKDGRKLKKPNEKITDFIKYNRKVIQGIEKLPYPISIYIKNLPEYKYGYFWSHYMQLLLERFGILLMAIINCNFDKFIFSNNSIESIIEGIDKLINTILSMNYSSNGKKEAESHYFDRMLAEVFKKFDNDIFSKESEKSSTMDFLNAKYKNETNNYKKPNKEIKDIYRGVYLERMIGEYNLFLDLNEQIEEHTKKKSILQEKNNNDSKTAEESSLIEATYIFPYLYESFLTGNNDCIPEEFEKLKYKNRIRKQLQDSYNMAMGLIKNELYLLMLLKIIHSRFKSEIFISFFKTCFDDLVILSKDISDLKEDGEIFSISDLLWESLYNSKDIFDWEDIFNEKTFGWHRFENIFESTKYEKRFYSDNLKDNKNFVIFQNFIDESISINHDFLKSALNTYEESISGYKYNVESYAKEIAEKVIESENLDDFSNKTVNMVDLYSEKLFIEYIEKEKYISQKYYQYRNQYNNKEKESEKLEYTSIEDIFNLTIGKIFKDIAIEEIKP